VNVLELSVHHLGDFLLHASIVVCAFCIFASAIGQRRGDGRLLLAAERGGYVVSAFIGTAALLLIHAFLTHDYQNKYVAHYSDNNMPWYYLIASFWGGQAGSLMFWSTTLAVVTALAASSADVTARAWILAVVTAWASILAVVTARAAILAVVTAPSASLAVLTAPSEMVAVTTSLLPIVTDGVLNRLSLVEVIGSVVPVKV
jgi:cytochrome c-type biogenesis protein CcmF